MDDLWVVLPHLGAGGAQKVGLLAAEHFAQQGITVRVLSLRPDHPVRHRVPDSVNLLNLDLSTQSELHPLLRDASNRALQARARRFSVAQLIKVQRGLLRLITLPLLQVLQLLLPWFETRVQPGRSGALTALLNHCMGSFGGLRYIRLRQLFLERQPRRVLALLSKTNILCCAAAWDLPIHLVVSERNDPQLQEMDPLWSRLRRICYTRADVVTANTEGVLRALRGMGHWTRLELLPNPLPAGVLRDDSAPSGQRRCEEVLAVARLVPQKGLDLLIRAFAALPESLRSRWLLTLVGDGPERQALSDLAQASGIPDRVVFEGFQSDPAVFMARASIFALPSRFEGMPNALLEAMAAGLPSVVSDASPGPLEMVSDAVHGLVVPKEDHAAFATALQALMVDPQMRRTLGSAARQKLRTLDWPEVEPHWRSVLALPSA